VSQGGLFADRVRDLERQRSTNVIQNLRLVQFLAMQTEGVGGSFQFP
jgi:hypothetical protein